jgi:hypothetical protein
MQPALKTVSPEPEDYLTFTMHEDGRQLVTQTYVNVNTQLLIISICHPQQFDLSEEKGSNSHGILSYTIGRNL